MSRDKSLDTVLKKTVEILEDSKRDIFSIGESTRKEQDEIKSELEEIRDEIEDVQKEVARLQRKSQQERIRLMKVSSDFYNFSENDIKEAYQRAEQTTVEIAVMEEKEDQLKKRKKELEKRIIQLKQTVFSADNLVSKVSIIRDFLMGELTSLSDEFDDLRQRNDLAIKIIQAQEEERRRLSREIHDGPAQSIANLVFRIELAQKLVDKDIDKAKKELDELKRLIRESMQDIRKIIYDLRPMSLDDLGLVPTLKKFINNYIKQTNIIIEFEVAGSQQRLSKTYEVTIFRLIQEALNNIFKHAEATSGKVRLEFAEKTINIFVSDDGKGFNISQVNRNKYGLMGMRERCNLLGGDIDITSKPGKGTKVKIILPLKKE
ncbi:MAG: sensor histidine kinase [Halanaerobiaceae bacterium]